MAGLPVWVFIYERASAGKGHALIFECAQRYADHFGLESPRGGILRKNGGKPAFVDGAVRFSVSHSGDIWACAVHDCEIGLDIQLAGGHRTEAIARRFFCEEEVGFLARHPQDFFKLWCAKEAAVKCSGEGIARGFLKTCVVKGGELRAESAENALHYFCPAEGYFACLCARNNGAGFKLIFERAAR